MIKYHYNVIVIVCNFFVLNRIVVVEYLKYMLPGPVFNIIR